MGNLYAFELKLRKFVTETVVHGTAITVVEFHVRGQKIFIVPGQRDNRTEVPSSLSRDKGTSSKSWNGTGRDRILIF